MICPNCGETLRERERSGIEIDVCPVCRGIWLDRGELDKLIDRKNRYYDDDDECDCYGGRREPAYAREGDRDRLYDDGARARDDRNRGYGDRDYGNRPTQKKEVFFQSLVETFGEGGEGGMAD